MHVRAAQRNPKSAVCRKLMVVIAGLNSQESHEVLDTLDVGVVGRRQGFGRATLGRRYGRPRADLRVASLVALEDSR